MDKKLPLIRYYSHDPKDPGEKRFAARWYFVPRKPLSKVQFEKLRTELKHCVHPHLWDFYHGSQLRSRITWFRKWKCVKVVYSNGTVDPLGLHRQVSCFIAGFFAALEL